LEWQAAHNAGSIAARGLHLGKSMAIACNIECHTAG
jgi:hypothetical protein